MMKLLSCIERLKVRSLFLVIIALSFTAMAQAQSPQVLYTWDGPANVDEWAKNFGTNNVTLDNSIPGVLTIVETGTPGEDVAIRDGFNRIIEASTGASGGLDLTGLDYLEFDLGHNGTGPVSVQFYVQASTGSNYLGLGPGPDFLVMPGMNTYQAALPPMTYEQQVYIRTVGFSIRDHFDQGNLTWTVGEVRSGGTPLKFRELVNHNAGSSDAGLQGAIANFEVGAIQGNNGGQNQTGLVHNATGPGSLQWVDLGTSVSAVSGGAVTWGNGTFWNGNSFNERMTDLSNYEYVTFRVKATDDLGGGGTVGLQPFFQFVADVATPTFQPAGFTNLPIDGQWHVLTYPLAGIPGLHLTSWTGINLAAHPNTITFDVDYIRFSVPEPATAALLALSAVALGIGRKFRV